MVLQNLPWMPDIMVDSGNKPANIRLETPQKE